MSEINRPLKEQLKEIKENNYAITGDINYFELTVEMLSRIGSPDPELRDDLIYLTLINWILNDEYTIDQLKYILNLLLDQDHLFYKIGEQDSDSVFTRSFSVLQIVGILKAERKKGFLSKQELGNIYLALIEYLTKEQDLRGYIGGKGWAHAIAHTADAITELSKLDSVNKNDLLKLLDVIRIKICTDKYVYINREDERMADTVVNILNNDLLDQVEIDNWIKGLSVFERTGDWVKDDTRYHNTKLFLRSIYFKIINNNDLTINLNQIIKTTLERLK
ncbi:MAG: DUF2785 domain-containing protein [Halanaerobiales bacterium]|nr:DUF2785 domain-containing protein [Halanaerobiales bacterium]